MEWYIKMNNSTKKDIRSKSRLARGLVEVLQYDTDNLVSDSNECHIDELIETLLDTKETLQNLTDIMTEIEYLLYLHKFKES